jgi:hypothetical protein
LLKNKSLSIALAMVALAVAIRPTAVQTSELSYLFLTFESQTWWKPQTGTVGVLTPERAAGYSHIHLRITAPAFQMLPEGTTFTPAVTTLLHNAYGYIKRVDSPFAVNGSDRTFWPIPPATGEPELIDTRTYAPYTVPLKSKNFNVQAPFIDTLNLEESRFVRMGFQMGSSEISRGFRTTSWMRHLSLGLGERGYKNVSTGFSTIAPVARGPLSGWWTVKFAVHESSGGHLHNVTVTIDPNFHSIDLAKRLGNVIWQDVNVDGDTRIVYIDTTKLANGSHRLAIIGDDEGQTSAGSLANVQQIWFEVQN